MSETCFYSFYKKLQAAKKWKGRFSAVFAQFCMLKTGFLTLTFFLWIKKISLNRLTNNFVSNIWLKSAEIVIIQFSYFYSFIIDFLATFPPFECIFRIFWKAENEVPTFFIISWDYYENANIKSWFFRLLKMFLQKTQSEPLPP